MRAKILLLNDDKLMPREKRKTQRKRKCL